MRRRSTPAAGTWAHRALTLFSSCGRRARAYVDGLPTIAMFANEPDAEHEPNCLFIFPTVSGRGRRVRLGDVHYGYLQTVTGVRRGAALTWCYGPSYVERGYPTTCGPS